MTTERPVIRWVQTTHGLVKRVEARGGPATSDYYGAKPELMRALCREVYGDGIPVENEEGAAEERWP
jgi:hypothetical protein